MSCEKQWEEWQGGSMLASLSVGEAFVLCAHKLALVARQGENKPRHDRCYTRVHLSRPYPEKVTFEVSQGERVTLPGDEDSRCSRRQRLIHSYILWIIDTVPLLSDTHAVFVWQAVHVADAHGSRGPHAPAAVVKEGARQCRPLVPPL